MTARQLIFELGHRPALGQTDFIVTASNQDAVAWLDRWPDWPSSGLALYGPAGCGKSHLVAVWQARSEARTLGVHDLTQDGVAVHIDSAGPLVLDDGETLLADGGREAEESLFHVYNALQARGDALLLAAAKPPAQWPLTLPDLASRLSALPTAKVGEPDDALLSAVLAKLFDDRQLAVEARVINYLATRMQRSFSAAHAVVAALDREALARKQPVTRPLAAEVLESQTQDGRR